LNSCIKCGELIEDESERFKGRIQNHLQAVRQLEDLVVRLKKGEVFLTDFENTEQNGFVDVDVSFDTPKQSAKMN
jgi:DNA-directed RNA polymerase subunit N (RpoN/RPB10)